MQYEIDCRGLACPEPVIRCRKMIDEQHPETLLVTVDNAAANENVIRLLTRSGYTVTTKAEGKFWMITGSVHSSGTGSVNAPGDAAPCTCTVSESAPGKTLILLTTSTLGHGNDELGAKLMENFLATLPEMSDSLWRIVLLNGGVKLAALPGKALESLKVLEASGVSILVCGSCLTFYDLLESRQVGETTNMLDVVTSLDLADKVIRP